MKNNEPIDNKKQEEEDKKSLLQEIIREGARKVLHAAIENEVSAYIDLFKDLRDETGRRMVVMALFPNAPCSRPDCQGY